MTTQQAISKIKMAKSGEYATLTSLYETIASKAELTDFGTLNGKGYRNLDGFIFAINEVRYALETITNGKVIYIATNDLDYYTIK